MNINQKEEISFAPLIYDKIKVKNIVRYIFVHVPTVKFH